MTQEQAVQETLKASSLHVRLMLLSKILTRSGYGDIQVLDRRENLQKSRYGGCELLCHTNLGPAPIMVIVKVIHQHVRTRMLDELAGGIDRTGSDFGIVVSTENLSRKAKLTQEKYRRSRVEIIDGKLFSEMLMKFKVGVRPNGDVDYAFFAEMENQLNRVNEFISHERPLR